MVNTALCFLVQRHFTHTVDGVVGIVHLLRHTVLSALHHHTASPHTTEVGTLNGVHQAAGIDGEHSTLLPIGMASIGIRYPFTRFCVINKNVGRAVLNRLLFGFAVLHDNIALIICHIFDKQVLHLVGCDGGGIDALICILGSILCTFLILTVYETGVFQLVVICFAVG